MVQNNAHDPCVIVIFGAGDLALRMLLGSIFKLQRTGELHPDTQILVIDKHDLRNGDLWDRAYGALLSLSHVSYSDDQWFPFAYRMRYFRLDLTAKSDEGWKALAEQVRKLRAKCGGNVLFNLSLPPHLYTKAIRGIGKHVLPDPEDRYPNSWRRIMVEKPFGEDARSAAKLNALIKRYFHERDVYRVDHYLGKDAVQSLLVLRFANPILEQIWKSALIDYVQITAAEAVGVEKRGMYDRIGALRDMVPNHLFQVLSLVTMPRPSALDPGAVREAQLKVLNSIKPIAHQDVVRGQYGRGNDMPGYRDECGNPHSKTETYVALRLRLGAGPLKGVPIYLRTGKRMPRKLTQILIQFKKPVTGPLAAMLSDEDRIANRLVINIQPEEGVIIQLEQKVPKPQLQLTEMSLQWFYGSQFPQGLSAPYEPIVRATLEGNLGLFSAGDHVIRSWELIDPIVRRFHRSSSHPVFYPAGSWGPPSPPDFPAWHNPDPIGKRGS